jgi:phosphoserine phosphatase
MEADDRAYLEKLVAARTGLTPADAKSRIDAVLQRVDEAAQQAKQAAETARKAGATVALVGALSLFVGAFIASAAAAFGGRLRDDNEGALNLRS